MILNRSNYEIWLIDYLDGNLDEIKAKQLLAFLEDNPDLRNEFEEISSLKIIPTGKLSAGKYLLKKTYSDLSADQFDFLCIADAENDLNEEQKTELEAIISEDPERRKTFDLFKKTRLKAPEIIYYRKSRLRKLTTSQKVLRLSVVGISIAAGLAMMIYLSNLSDNSIKELAPLATENSSLNLVKSDSAVNSIAVNTTTRDKVIIKPSGIIVQNTIINSKPAEKIQAVEKQQARELSSTKIELLPINISKSDYKPEVILVQNTFEGTLASMKIADISPVEQAERPGLNSLIARLFREKILKSKEPETGSLKPYEIADAGILGLNKLLGWQMSLQKNHDENGDLKSLYFSSKILKFSAPVRKDQILP